MAELQGGLGVSSITTGTRDTRLIDRALRQKWDIPTQVFEKLPMQMVGIAIDRLAGERNRIAATRVLVQMHGQNEQQDNPAEPPTVNVNVAVVVPVAIEQASDDDLVRFLAATGGLADAGAAPGRAAAGAAGVLPAPANGKANGVSGNGKH